MVKGTMSNTILAGVLVLETTSILAPHANTEVVAKELSDRTVEE